MCWQWGWGMLMMSQDVCWRCCRLCYGGVHRWSLRYVLFGYGNVELEYGVRCYEGVVAVWRDKLETIPYIIALSGSNIFFFVLYQPPLYWTLILPLHLFTSKPHMSHVQYHISPYERECCKIQNRTQLTSFFFSILSLLTYKTFSY